MQLPATPRADLAALPAVLRSLLEAELAAGNEIEETGHSFPAPPAGAYFRLARPVTTRPRRAGDGLEFRERNSSLYSGEFTDSGRFFFILEPALPPPPEPDMNAIRLAHAPASWQPSPGSAYSPGLSAHGLELAEPPSALQRFADSMVIDYDKWHDGIGYDLTALHELSAQEKGVVEGQLLERGLRDWRDVEALAALATPGALAALRAAILHPDPAIRNAVTSRAPGLVTDAERTTSLVQGLGHAMFYGGLTQTLDQVADFHPPAVIDALLRGALERKGEVAVHFAAMLCFIHGKSAGPFDMAQRPFFLRFNTTLRGEREAAFRELCTEIGADSSSYLASSTKPRPELAPTFHVVVDHQAELLTYHEPGRSSCVTCTFNQRPRIHSRTLSNWWYPQEGESKEMTALEKPLVLERIAKACQEAHGMTDLTLLD